MTRVRTDNVFGTVSDNPLTNSATTLNSAGLADLAVVSSAEALIVLDPNRVAGAPEIVVVTAHTGSATSATIQRGQFGTSARQHAAGTEWVHGPIAGNASTYTTAADDQGDYVPMNAWESWTPTLTNLTLGNGTVTAKFQRVGRTIHYRFEFKMGSTSAVGSGPQFSLPVQPHADYVDIASPIGSCFLRDAGTATFHGSVRYRATGIGEVVTAGDLTNGVQAVSATAPFTWAGANEDRITAIGTYEAAS